MSTTRYGIVSAAELSRRSREVKIKGEMLARLNREACVSSHRSSLLVKIGDSMPDLGGASSSPRRIANEYQGSFKTAYLSKKKPPSMHLCKECPSCVGDGGADHDDHCDVCDGAGGDCDGAGGDCDGCGGSGSIARWIDYWDCNGSGTQRQDCGKRDGSGEFEREQ
ncbi:hypothetical protein EK21DRAFT_83984 [Setomelanomma holmii]|uniref:Uncharacterized protein n=1 Tax=Setomelanomma holmii TaxID=210430 RepID=A0A9P4LV17_9PLEO|nr:hypothetical protein EK21DRAFT_83984 [Setomelanomma holmii]